MIKLHPIDSRFAVPKRDEAPTEFEIQAALWAGLVERGLDVRGEVKWFDPDLRIQCRFDLVIYEGDEAQEIIEVKSTARKWMKTPLEDTRQGRRYRLFGVPVTFLYGIEDVKDYLAGRDDESAGRR